MSSKVPTFLIWDVSTCKSTSIDIVEAVQDIVGLSFSTIFVFANQVNQIPQAISDLSIAFNTNVTFGDYALYDVISNLIASLNGKKQFNIAIVSTKLSVWLSLFQQKQPSNLFIFSTTDPRQDFDFSFLPPTIPTKIYSWPNLDIIDGDVSGSNLHVEEESPKEPPPKKAREAKSNRSERTTPSSQKSQPIQRSSEEAEEDSFSYNEEALQNTEESELQQHDQASISQEYETAPSQNSPISAASPVFAQRNLLESNKRLNFNRTEPKEESENSPPLIAKSSKARTQRISAPNAGAKAIQVSAQFKPLVESMKLVGKSMVSYGDFLTSLRGWCKVENTQVDDPMELINAGVAAGVVIYDASINYLRFRNRTLSTSNVEYV
ncbi:hypothetical protein TVAG_198380 [Trichomonas vaginalis G3]|uniref:Uncharacterized protein n=1 Tax=Trichomonas vaginalis (strain ATCC PRA-98 / G3) TaxID=412133 RepID=A2DDM4_TRIV3|nr:hypothetical protein TVAGG3_0998800 [Trichomonas vaginalis G3]EAY21400.1 hypothetical protein TVAG_198380 [Trichomonas vaginalis G3]KAI5490613.1 hypothetical protein TVAGG3_0998800 [Trichomonas vaginalis G3]|eukprot:XP_001582386.1 hypothetical protein [Trichomonas vaginalis G3]